MERNCPGDIKCDNKITGGLRSCGMVLSFTPPMRLQFPRLGLSGYLAAADCQRELLLCAVCCFLCAVFCVLCVPRSHVVCIWQDPSSRLTSGAHVAGLAALVMEAEIGNRPQRPQSMPQPRPPLPLTASPIRFIPSVVSPKSSYFLLNLLRHICLCFEKLGALQPSPACQCIYDFSSIRFEGFFS